MILFIKTLLYFSMKQILNDIIEFFVTIWSSLWSFFANMETYIIGLVVMYIITIIILIVWLQYSRKTFNTINTLFRVSMDDLYYQISILLYRNKNNIYDFQSNIPLLLQYKTQEIKKKDKAAYYNNYIKLIDEIEYIWQLTDSPITYNRNELNHQYTLVHKLDNTIHQIKNSLSLLTLGLARIFF